MCSMKKRISLTLDERLIEFLKAAAQQDHRSISNEVEKELLEKYMPSSGIQGVDKAPSKAVSIFLESFEKRQEVYRRLADS